MYPVHGTVFVYPAVLEALLRGPSIVIIVLIFSIRSDELIALLADVLDLRLFVIGRFYYVIYFVNNLLILFVN